MVTFTTSMLGLAKVLSSENFHYCCIAENFAGVLWLWCSACPLQDALRAKRRHEEFEREWRRKEREEMIKK
jgi:hypothetical protein